MGLSWWDFEQEQKSNEILMPGGGVKGRLFDFSHMWAWAVGTGLLAVTKNMMKMALAKRTCHGFITRTAIRAGHAPIFADAHH